LDVHVIEHFLTTDSTLFLIEAMTARDITGYTKYPNEHEVILPLGINLDVVANSMAHTGGLHVVHLREIEVCKTKYNNECSSLINLLHCHSFEVSKHSKCLLSVPFGNSSSDDHEIVQAHSLKSKIVREFRRTFLKKSCKVATVTLILVGIVVGISIGVVTRKTNSLSTTRLPSDSTIQGLTTLLFNSSDIVLVSTLATTVNTSECPTINLSVYMFP
jgi:hypothetical protein